jgi:hypothetical protein
MGRSKRAADRIREVVPILDVLLTYGYAVHPEGGDREQQFSCDLHGDGLDTKPSARVYPDSASFHCFACGRSRDAITLIQEKEGVSFWKAVKILEGQYDLPPIPWSPEDAEQSTAAAVADALGHTPTPDEAIRRTERFLLTLTSERIGLPSQIAALWEAHDRVAHMHREGIIEDGRVPSLCLKILDTAKELAGVDA